MSGGTQRAKLCPTAALDWDAFGLSVEREIAYRLSTDLNILSTSFSKPSSVLCDGEKTDDRQGPAVATPKPSAAGSSYGEILKSSAVVGGAQVLNIAIGIARTKAIAMLLGPGGFGLAGVYNSIAELTQSIAGLGVNSSGVRQIAEAVGTQDNSRISLTVAVLRRTSIVLGSIAALVLVVFCRQVSVVTFGNTKYSSGVAALSIVAFCKLVSGGQGALIQGMRRIGDLAKMNVLGAFFGAIAAIALVYVLRENGIVLYLIAVAMMTVLMSWWYSRKIRLEAANVKQSHLGQEARALLKLGFAFMISSMMTLGVAYATRVIIMRRVGITGTGLYQSAWTLGGMYVGFILQAMGADFYPRLTAHINDHAVCNRLVNEQAQIGLLLATPGVIGTLIFAPIVIAVFYSTKFGDSVPILRWICLGTLLQVITWPMGFIIVAKARQNLFIFCEVAWAIVSLALTWICVGRYGIAGAGIAFFFSYIFHTILLYPVARSLTGFRWSKENAKIGLLFLSLVAAVFYGIHALPSLLAVIIGTLAFAITTAYSVRALLRIVLTEDFPGPIRSVLGMFRANPSRSVP